MALDVASFLVRYPEFSAVGDAMIEARIADAAAKVNATVWGDELDHGQALWTAHLLSCSPAGQQARLVGDKTRTTYQAAYEEAATRLAAGRRVYGAF